MKKLIIPLLALFLLTLLVISIPDDVTARRARAYGVSCEDTDNGYTYDVQGNVTLTGRRGEKEFTDYCRDDNRILEYKCGKRYGGWIAFNRIRYCDREFGEGFSCVEGACIEKNYYDDFESGELNEDLWEIRRDPENQPFMDEYGVREEDDNWVFHTQQNEIADRRVCLVPTHMFTEGDIFEFDENLVSREGHYGNPIIFRGNGWNRQIIGVRGYNNGVQGYDELGWGHTRIEFSDGEVRVTREAPSEEVFSWNVELPNPNGEYEIYICSFSGHNGRVHYDFDNFELNSEEEEEEPEDDLEEYNVDENTIALWHFNEGEGDRVYDETENDNDGTIREAVWTQDGRFGNALSFDGENDLISIPYQRVLIPEDITLEAWIKKSSDARGSVISKNGPYYLGFINEDNRVVGSVYAWSDEHDWYRWAEAYGTTELELDTWYHIAMTYDRENVKVYVNGVEDGSTEADGEICVTNQALHIGWGEPGVNFYFDGLIDEVRISNIAREYNGEEEH